jgi:hypothetical protein
MQQNDRRPVFGAVGRHMEVDSVGLDELALHCASITHNGFPLSALLQAFRQPHFYDRLTRHTEFARFLV